MGFTEVDAPAITVIIDAPRWQTKLAHESLMRRESRCRLSPLHAVRSTCAGPSATSDFAPRSIIARALAE
jgi:hypothetical protein